MTQQDLVFCPPRIPEPAPADAEQFAILCDYLTAHCREGSGIKIADITALLNMPNRRATEQFLERVYRCFPFPVISGDTGYRIAESREAWSRYAMSLRSRIRCAAIRIKYGCLQAASLPTS